MRIGGIASGMDTDTMVKEMMKAENIKVDRVKAQMQIAEWKKETLNSLNKDFASFILDAKKNFGYNSLGRPGSNMDWLKKAISSDEKVATIKSKSGVPDGTHNIEVKNIAEGVKGGSNNPIDSSKTFADMLGLEIGTEDPKTEDETMSIKINGAEIKVSAKDNIEDFVRAINNAKIDTGKVGEDGKPIMESIGVKASYDGATKRFFISSEKTGAEAGKIDIEATDSNAKKFVNETLDLRISSNDEADGGYKSRAVSFDAEGKASFKGIDAKIEYNGLEIEQSSNEFNVNGMNLSIKDIGKITVNISTDIDGAVEKIKEFVDSYNAIIEKAGSLLSEKKNKSYQPLTDEERKALGEKEIELWDQKAKSGVIRGDSDIERMISSMRSSLYENVAGDHGEVRYKDKDGIYRTSELKNITQIGITTQKYKSGSTGGQLMIDEEKLREALAFNPEGVMNMLFSEDKNNAIRDDNKLSKEERATKRSNSGLVTRVFDEMIVGMKEIIGKSGAGGSDDLLKKVRQTIMGDFVTNGGRYSGAGSVSDLDSDIMKLTKRVNELNSYLFKKENSYYAKFTAMEKAMQRTQSQSGWLQQQM